MTRVVDDVLLVEVEPFPFTPEILHMVFQLRIPTVSRVPTRSELYVCDAWIAEVKLFITKPDDTETSLRFLLFYTCILNMFQPTRAC